MNTEEIKKGIALYYVMSLQGNQWKSAYDIARNALEGGVTTIQLREKIAPMKQIIKEGLAIRKLCKQYNALFMVNDRVDLAILLQADGVHLGQDDIPCILARKLLGENAIIGISAGTYEEAHTAVKDGADYLGIGSIYATYTKSDAGEPIGTSLIKQVRNEWSIPIVGIGGIQVNNAASVIQAGADGIAVVSAISSKENPGTAARELHEIIIQQLPS